MTFGSSASADDQAGPARASERNRICGRGGFFPFGLAFIALGFLTHWWIALVAFLGYKIWRHHGSEISEFAGTQNWRGRGFGPDTWRQHWSRTGNTIFDEWKAAEVERLEAERRKLAEAERDFAFFLDQLRRAKDREEFDRFMAARRAAEQQGNEPPKQ
ncbi:DUF2852 domain-containing protein [Methylovirgula sp. 4M-Z18]|uniref:DUF2852 domain-containing protein n=1 Tax=Methylovirgula sp. 4M-Z18 TaxID=2293567 RepID=UPI001314E5C6|nr:DUF2852 domain-containing protein [Methylovirgula sp. 4M-Z18]